MVDLCGCHWLVGYSMAIFFKGEEFTIYRTHVIHLNETADYITNGRDKVLVYNVHGCFVPLRVCSACRLTSRVGEPWCVVGLMCWVLFSPDPLPHWRRRLVCHAFTLRRLCVSHSTLRR